MKLKNGGPNERGAVFVEQLVLLSAVAIGFAGACVALAPVLLARHQELEFLFLLPIP